MNLLNGNANVGIGIGGDDLLDVDVGIGGGGDGGSVPGPNPGGNSNGGNGGGGLFANSNSSTNVNNCAGLSVRELERLILATRIDGSWRRAINVNIRRVEVCPELRPTLAAALQQTGLGNSLRSAISGDELVAATLNRASYGADRVFAVKPNGRELIVFVY